MSKTNQISEHINDISQYLTPSQRKRLERKVKKNANNEQPTYAKTERHHQNKIASIRPIIPKTQTQKYLLDCLDYYNQNIVFGPAGSGKAQPLDSKIMTINGWKLMRDIELGDLVLDENGNYIDRPYTKDEFYEAMKRMIKYGPSDWNYVDKAPDYRDMTGEFRVRNAELFISEEAPVELQKKFYTKSITPQLLLEHTEYIQFLSERF